MAPQPGLRALDALRAIHDAAWDPDAGMVRLLPGATPGLDLRAFGLHAVRETALGAHLDLLDGRTDRAAAALRRVVAAQIIAPGTPWHGTFRVAAEQPDPPEVDAVEWVHYDPNWRQFTGTILAVLIEDHGADLPDDLVAAMEGAVALAVAGEPEDRIPDWYTNPALLHAWLEAWSGARAGDRRGRDRGVARARRLAARVEAQGDVDEYSSPTYDGIDLLALALWVALPPTEEMAELGTRLLAVLGARIGALHSTHLHVMTGPYVRAYGLGLTDHVALMGLWLALAGEPETAVLPSPLVAETVHVHDLAFLPLFARLSEPVLAHLVRRTDVPRRHEQRFGGIVATSVVGRRSAIGAERGRVPTFSRDQYVPLTVHAVDEHDHLHWVGLRLGPTTTAIDAEADDERSAHATVRTDGGGSTDVVLVSSSTPIASGPTLQVGPIAVTVPGLQGVSQRDVTGGERRLVLEAAPAEVRLSIRVGRDTPDAPRTRRAPRSRR